ncbi:hypothetical protein K438DRAFT_1793147 [Mycena galopus ATCC 62051]|nr:hypothetical protein K438DRAFT_1793147 [Mycena galopus ATCC 62051]
MCSPPSWRDASLATVKASVADRVELEPVNVLDLCALGNTIVFMCHSTHSDELTGKKASPMSPVLEFSEEDLASAPKVPMNVFKNGVDHAAIARTSVAVSASHRGAPICSGFFKLSIRATPKLHANYTSYVMAAKLRITTKGVTFTTRTTRATVTIANYVALRSRPRFC